MKHRQYCCRDIGIALRIRLKDSFEDRGRKRYQGYSEQEDMFSISVFTIGFVSKSFDCAIYLDQVSFNVRFFLVAIRWYISPCASEFMWIPRNEWTL